MYASGLYSTQGKTPTASIETTVASGTDGYVNVFRMNVNGVESAISTGDLKLVTTWTSTNATTGKKVGNTTTIMREMNKDNYSVQASGAYNAPLGFGSGVTGAVKTSGSASSPYPTGQYFGNYTLIPGTYLRNNGADSMEALFGKNYRDLKRGDTVTVELLYIPTGTAVYSKEVTVA